MQGMPQLQPQAASQADSQRSASEQVVPFAALMPGLMGGFMTPQGVYMHPQLGPLTQQQLMAMQAHAAAQAAGRPSPDRAVTASVKLEPGSQAMVDSAQVSDCFAMVMNTLIHRACMSPRRLHACAFGSACVPSHLCCMLQVLLCCTLSGRETTCHAMPTCILRTPSIARTHEQQHTTYQCASASHS